LPNQDRAAWSAELARRYPALSPALVRDLAHRHGTRATIVLGDARTTADLGEDFGAGLTAREIAYLREHDWAFGAEDILWRRTKCGLPMTSAERERVADYVGAA
jgi:glycerol-3-phosphate dehydrogenase